MGVSKRAKELCPDVKWDDLGHDGIVIRTVGNDLLLAGGEPRGTLYAVYTFLEDVVGIRWWTGSESFIPQKPTLDVGTLNTVYVPPFKYREAFYNNVIDHNYIQATRLKLNGHMTDTPAEWGGHYTIIGWCHTFFQLLPPDKYFAQHPEWYAQIDGKRTTGGQLCLSNDEMRAEMVKQALEQIRKNPDAGIISIAQNDCFNPCQCEKCQQIVREEGSESGPVIRFVNQVAAEIQKQYPDFLVETLAYQYTRHPPKLVKPASNVIVRLCSIEADFARPLAGETNKDFADDMNGWAAISPNLFVWNYVTDFISYFQPQPNMTPLGADLRWFVDHHVIGVFEQGDAFNQGAGDFLQLRCWMLAHLLWNPNLDQTKVRDEFLNGYYGAAGPYLGKYLDLLNKLAAEKMGFADHCYNGDMSFLTPAALDESLRLFAEGAKAVAADPVLAKRVRREQLPLDMMKLGRYDFDGKMREAKQAGRDVQSVCTAYDKEVNAFDALARAEGAKNWSEGQPFEAGINAMHAHCAEMIPPEIPAAGRKLPENQFDIPQDQFTLAGIGKWADLADDAKASDGKAARLIGNHVQWAVQYHVTGKTPGPIGPGPWRCYLVVRVDTKEKTGNAFQFGVWDHDHAVVQSGTSLDRFHDGEYHPVLITLNELKPDMYFWVAPFGDDKAVPNIYVDRIFFVRDKK